MGFHYLFLFCGSADIWGQRETLKTSVLFRGTLDPKTWLKIPPKVFYPRGIDIGSLWISPTWFKAERSSTRMFFHVLNNYSGNEDFFPGMMKLKLFVFFYFGDFPIFRMGDIQYSIDIPCISSSCSLMVLFHILSSRAFDVLDEDVLEWFEYSKKTHHWGFNLCPAIESLVTCGFSQSLII